MKKYKIRVTSEHETEMIRIVQLNKYPGIFWPNSTNEDAQFELTISEQDLLVLKLLVPCQLMT